MTEAITIRRLSKTYATRDGEVVALDGISPRRRGASS